MNFIAHRGLWEIPEQKNTAGAFIKALQLGFGIETDVRDYRGELVISHDIPSDESIKFSEFLAIVKTHHKQSLLAINVKSDGLQDKFEGSAIEEFNHFYFDMSVPDALIYSKLGMEFYTRYSDIEPSPSLFLESKGIWLDNFSSNTFDMEAAQGFLTAGKRVALVSPELHGYCYKEYWSDVKEYIAKNREYLDFIDLCTDYPLQAQEFFNE